MALYSTGTSDDLSKKDLPTTSEIDPFNDPENYDHCWKCKEPIFYHRGWKHINPEVCTKPDPDF